LQVADDAVLLAESVPSACASLTTLSGWGDANMMEYSAVKSAVMIVSHDQDAARSRLASAAAGLLLQGNNLPQTTSYVYIGFPFVDTLSPSESVKLFAAKKKSALSAIQIFMTKSVYPLPAKFALLRSVAMPMCSYGGEVLGMLGKAVLQPLARLFDNCVVALCQGWGKCCAAVLRRDLQLPSVHAVAAAARVRAVRKYKSVKTVISALVRNKFSSRTKVWSSGSRGWMKKNNVHSTTTVREVRAKVDNGLYAKMCLENSRNPAVNVGVAFYNRHHFIATRGFIKSYIRLGDFSLEAGIAALLACRAKGFWTAPRSVRAKLIPDRFKNRCPCCDAAGTPETLEHLMLHCPRWTSERTAHLDPVLTAANALAHAPQTDKDKTVVLLGGGGGLGCSFDSLNTRWFRLARRSPLPLFLNVARFFAGIKTTRQSIYSSIRGSQTSLSPSGTAVLSAG
jgi:hypothetical protein